MSENKNINLQMGLILQNIPIKFCKYDIKNSTNNMFNSECIGISAAGILFHSSIELEKRSLLRILVEVPGYWARKSRIVEYQQTNVPTHFQIFSRVVMTEKKDYKFPYKILCENLNIDSVDQIVLQDFLNSVNISP